jgi:hypothetical protein
MRALPANLRKELEAAVLGARRAAESASRAALDMLGVFSERRPEHLDANRVLLRNGLRAKWRQLGGDRELLVAECAYEQWHRLLFARFLAENDLLLHPQHKAAVTLADCDDLAAELGEPDGWSVAARFAAEILPGIFRLNDPCVLLRLAPEGRYELEQVLANLPDEVFAADDSLGWVYQFWQKDKKDEVNASERKIGGADLGPVTQLFTENYMVRFLLENSLGAWWATKHPESPLIKGFEYLRLDDGGKPAAGSFDGWPERVAEVTVMDPCCGSGHFLVEAFSMLWQMRAAEEGLQPIEAQDSVLRENLFGLELDPRCVQIAMFSVAFQAWKSTGKWRQLPVPNIACSGIPVKASAKEWTELAQGDARLESSLRRLHGLFREADTLGSLINPKAASGVTDSAYLQISFEDAEWEEIAPLLAKAAIKEHGNPAITVLEYDAAEVASAAKLLSGRYTLVVTNVPYLESRSQSFVLREYLTQNFYIARYDLAAAFMLRCLELANPGGGVATVSPQNLLLLKSYDGFRRKLIGETAWLMICWLGAGAFGGISGEVVNVALGLYAAALPDKDHVIHGLDLSRLGFADKAVGMREDSLLSVSQAAVSRMPDVRFSLVEPAKGELLEKYAYGLAGIMTGDSPRFVRYFWEVVPVGMAWRYFQSTVAQVQAYGGRDSVIFWDNGEGGEFFRFHRENRDRLHDTHQRGSLAWGRKGVAVRSIGTLPATLYTGERFDNNVAVLLPKKDEFLPALWAYVSSPEYVENVRLLDRKMNVTNATLVKVPFDYKRWREVSEQMGPLPEPWSDDPTQWLFNGQLEITGFPLQVAVARLLGYRWPEQVESDRLDEISDSDGIVCLPSVAGEQPASERIQQMLAKAFGDEWSPAYGQELLEKANSRRRNLAEWLRDEFFKQHCALFKNRPFVWHIWDGQRDGFSALVNYHRLDRKLLEKLIYTYLGQDWVERQRAAVRDEVPGAENRLSAALALQRKLEAILEGEKPYDIYIRWKEVHEQPIGWEPDLNDGVRLNIRPFVEAGVLRSPLNIHWRKDRGKNHDEAERVNDMHLSLAEKRAARLRVGLA